MRNWWQRKKFTSPQNHSRGIFLALSERSSGNEALSKRTYLKGGVLWQLCLTMVAMNPKRP